MFLYERLQTNEKIRTYLGIIIKQEIAIGIYLTGHLQALIVATGKAVVPIKRGKLHANLCMFIDPCLETRKRIIRGAIVYDIHYKFALSLR
jgi:hypothetical protein